MRRTLGPAQALRRPPARHWKGSGGPPAAFPPGGSPRPPTLRDLSALLPFAALLMAVVVIAWRDFQPGISGDYLAHLDYLRYVNSHHWFPRADQGFEMYHPPVYYVTSVVAAQLAGVFHAVSLSGGARAVATAAWILEGIVAAAVVHRMRGTWLAMSAAVGVVWLLPGQANVGTRIYPETAAGLGVGLLVLGIVTLAEDRSSGAVWLGLGLPIAALSKFSGLVAVAVALPIALWAMPTWRRRVLVAASPGAALAGAFYVRNVILFGTPTPLNADLFHLKAHGGTFARYPDGFFTHVSLGRCAAEHSFYGSVWKWFWATDCGVKPPWRETVGGWLLVAALLGSAVCLAAIVWALLRWRDQPARLAVAAIPLATFLAFLAYNARVPSGSSGLYLLVAVVPSATAIGLFIDRLAPSWRWPGYILLLLWALVMATASGVFT